MSLSFCSCSGLLAILSLQRSLYPIGPLRGVLSGIEPFLGTDGRGLACMVMSTFSPCQHTRRRFGSVPRQLLFWFRSAIQERFRACQYHLHTPSLPQRRIGNRELPRALLIYCAKPQPCLSRLLGTPPGYWRFVDHYCWPGGLGQ